MTDIIERLRIAATHELVSDDIALEAADTIEALRTEIAALRSGDTCARQCEGTAYRLECRTLRARVAELEKDAARYRWLRRGQHWSVINGVGDILRADVLDTAIDVATKG